MGASGRRCWAATLTLGAVARVTLILARTGSKRPPPERPPPSPGPAAQPGPEADLPGPRLAAEPDICSELQERSTRTRRPGQGEPRQRDPVAAASRSRWRQLGPEVAGLRVVAQHRAPAVHRHDRAVDGAGIVSEQPGDRRGDLLGTPDTAKRVQPAQLLADAGGRGRLLAGQQRLLACVAIEPSATALTRMPRGPSSTASARVRPSTAALAVA